MAASKRPFQYIAVFCFIGLIRKTLCLGRPSTMVLENNGYKNVVIAIHESVAEDKSLIDKLKDEMTKASKILHTATKQRAYFKEIKILLPSTWSNDASYQAPTTENLAFADVIITDPIKGKRSLPQTRSYDGCGKQGVHVLLTKEFLTMPRADPYLTNPAKYFIHAFASFRWGVFQEYAEEGENVFYMSPSSGQPEAIRCTFSIRGLVQKDDASHAICYSKLLAERQHVVASVDENTGLYDAACQWRPYPSHQRTTASIMDHQFIAELVTFCGDDPTDYKTIHNYEAPSKHNRLCGHRSTWGVITETDDFRGGINPARALSDDQLKPTFTIMRATSRKRRSAVLIDPMLMQEMSKAKTIQRSLGHLQHESSHLGIDVTLLQTQGNNIPHGTSLKGDNAVDSTTDSHYQDEDKFASHIMETINNYKNVGEDKDAHLVIVTGNITENIECVLKQGEQHALELSFITNQTTAAINNQQEKYAVHGAGATLGHTLLDRLRHALLIERTNRLVVTQEEFVLSNSLPFTGYAYIDSTLGNHISFIFHFEEDIPEIYLSSPSDVVYGTDADVSSVDDISKVILFHFDSSEVGAWKYTVRQSSKTPEKVHVTVISEDNNAIDPVLIRQSVKFTDSTNNSLLLHVDVTQGVHPLLGLDVTATIEMPNGDVASVRLVDNGAGADISKNDGVYSRIYLAPGLSGSYHVTFVLSGTSGKVFRKEESFMVTKNGTNPIKKNVTKHPVKENIQRQVSGGTVYINHTGNSGAILDNIAPSRIADLEVLRYIPYRNNLVLKWTAPGDDHDLGTPAGYELYVGYGTRDVRLFLQYISEGIYDGQGHIAKENITARAKGTEDEIVLWSVKEASKIYVFGVRAVDKYGNKGDISNIATAAIKF